VGGRALVHRLDVGRHLSSPVPPEADYYPVLLAALKLAVALLLARLAWRVARARATEVAARRLLGAVGPRPGRTAPRVSLRLSPSLWAAFFLATSVMYLLQAGAEQAVAGRVALLDPWLHTSALPVFAVVSVALALLWGTVQRWLVEYERLAEEVAAQAWCLMRGACPPSLPRATAYLYPPRQLFGLAFESRPPPLPA